MGASINKILVGGRSVDPLQVQVKDLNVDHDNNLVNDAPIDLTIGEPDSPKPEIVAMESRVVSLYFLAHKYTVTRLIEHILSTIDKWTSFSNDQIVRVFEAHLSTLDFPDDQLKKILAKIISQNYASVRKQETEAARKIHNWLEEDAILMLYVGDTMALKSQNCTCSTKKRSRSSNAYSSDTEEERLYWDNARGRYY